MGSETPGDKVNKMVKIYRFMHQGHKVVFAHHSHPFLGKYTALSIGRKRIITGRTNKAGIIKHFDEFMQIGRK
jgi:hypothetical protein